MAGAVDARVGFMRVYRPEGRFVHDVTPPMDFRGWNTNGLWAHQRV